MGIRRLESSSKLFVRITFMFYTNTKYNLEPGTTWDDIIYDAYKIKIS